jgi:hypothetical protein
MDLSYKNIEFHTSSSPSFKNENTFIWGFPINEDALLNGEWTPDILNTISGYYFAIRICENKIQIVNDVLGGESLLLFIER